MVKGKVFDIKRFATDDGPGIRTLVFLKGCSLRCKWCANPESHLFTNEVMYYAKKCAGCGKCISICPQLAIRKQAPFGLVTSTDCTGCGLCEDACLYSARKLMGRDMTTEQVMETVRKDRSYYAHSGGGLTLSGGEPLLQPEFAFELLKKSKNEGIGTAVETCGGSKWKVIERSLPFIDYLYYDIKLIDPAAHKHWTGADNKLILDNLNQLNRAGYQGTLIVRIPYIPGVNDADDTQREMYEYLKGFSAIDHIEVMPFHRFGAGKYRGLGRTYEFEEYMPVSKSAIAHLEEIGREAGVDVRIGTD